MNVLFLTEGGGKTGLGHVTRCFSLYQAFKEKGINPNFVVNGDSLVSNLLEDKSLRILNWLRVDNFLAENVVLCDIVIIDSYLADKFVYEEISKMMENKLLIMIDDYKRIDYPKGIIVNPSINENNLDYQKKDNTLYLLGNKYILLRKEFWDPPEKVIRKDVKKITISFGGTGQVDLACQILNNLKGNFDFQYLVIDPKQKSLKADELLDLMMETDIWISGGGQSLNELARVGVPTIGICFKKNQLRNLVAWKEKGFIEYAGWFNGENLNKNIEDCICRLTQQETRNKSSQIGKSNIGGQGARRVVEKVLKYKCN